MSITKIYIENDRMLAEYFTEIEKKQLIGVDTEFMRVSSYFPKLCLIQIATSDALFCIDVLKITDITSLKSLFTKTDTLKIFHSSNQDLEAISVALGVCPSPIFDTQAAETILGSDHPLSYQATVESYFEVILEKNETRTDWSKRPLTAEQIEYAYQDIEYLLPLHNILLARLSSSQLKQLETNLEVLAQYDNFLPNPDLAWKKVKKYKLLRGKRLTRLKSLAKERELIAINENLPKRWIISDEDLIELASNPQSSTENTINSMVRNRKFTQLIFPLVQAFAEEDKP